MFCVSSLRYSDFGFEVYGTRLKQIGSELPRCDLVGRAQLLEVLVFTLYSSLNVGIARAVHLPFLDAHLSPLGRDGPLGGICTYRSEVSGGLELPDQLFQRSVYRLHNRVSREAFAILSEASHLSATQAVVESAQPASSDLLTSSLRGQADVYLGAKAASESRIKVPG